MTTIKQQARVSGLLYLLLSIVAPLGIVIVPGRLFVGGDPAATAANLAASDWLLRLGIASELLNQVIQIFLVLALFRLFRAVHEGLARQVVILGALVSVPIVFVNVLTELAATILVNGGVPLGLDPAQTAGLAYLAMQLHAQGIIVVEVFWGLWLFPFGLLVIRSGFIPKAFGNLLLVAGSAYFVGSFATILLPQWAAAVSQVVNVLVFAEVPIIFYLLIWGASSNAALTESPAA